MGKTIKDEKQARMIHVRLSSVTHRRLRVLAAELDTSIQNLVESLVEKALSDERKKGSAK